jgi:hypothetical protein
MLSAEQHLSKFADESSASTRYLNELRAIDTVELKLPETDFKGDAESA